MTEQTNQPERPERPERQEFIAGLDLGQQGDYTALAIIERVNTPEATTGANATETGVAGARPSLGHILRTHGPATLQRALITAGYGAPGMTAVAASAAPVPASRRERVVYHLRYLDRPALGTPYPAIVAEVCDLLARPPLAGATALVVDATGVGRPVVDLLRDDRRLRASLTPVTITGGDAVSRDGHEYRVPKRDLVGATQVLLQTGRLVCIPGLPLQSVFIAELMNFKAKISLSGHDTYEAGPAGQAGAWREGAHDDLVLAVALACWYGERPQPRIRFLDAD